MSTELTMSFNEFFEMERGNITLNKIIRDKNIRKFDDIAGKILRNENLRKACVFSLALSMMCVQVFAEDKSTAEAMGKVGAASSKIISILQFSIGKVCIIACILEIGKSLIAKRREEIPQIGMKYLIAYLVVKLVPWLFDLIDETF
jgi:hypothetical protein